MQNENGTEMTRQKNRDMDDSVKSNERIDGWMRTRVEPSGRMRKKHVVSRQESKSKLKIVKCRASQGGNAKWK